jgi:putative addiction module killer protein
MNTLMRTDSFSEWLKALRDPIGKARILARLKKAEAGHFGDCKPVGEAVYEMRIDAGPGYRIYYTRQGEVTYFLLVGGDKSTQSEDIQNAQGMAKVLKEQNP